MQRRRVGLEECLELVSVEVQQRQNEAGRGIKQGRHASVSPHHFHHHHYHHQTHHERQDNSAEPTDMKLRNRRETISAPPGAPRLSRDMQPEGEQRSSSEPHPRCPLFPGSPPCPLPPAPTCPQFQNTMARHSQSSSQGSHRAGLCHLSICLPTSHSSLDRTPTPRCNNKTE